MAKIASLKLWLNYGSIPGVRKRRLPDFFRIHFDRQTSYIENSRNIHLTHLPFLEYFSWSRGSWKFAIWNLDEWRGDNKLRTVMNSQDLGVYLIVGHKSIEPYWKTRFATSHLETKLSMSHLLISTISNELKFLKLCPLKRLLQEPHLSTNLLILGD